MRSIYGEICENLQRGRRIKRFGTTAVTVNFKTVNVVFNNITDSITGCAFDTH